MRIAFLPSSYLPESVGGTEFYVHTLALSLAAAGHQVAVVYHSKNPGTTIVDGYEIFRLPDYVPQNRADLYLISSGKDPPGFVPFLDRWQPDVVHFHALTFGAGPDHCRALRKRGLRYYVTYHTPTFSCQRGSLMRWGKEVCDGIIRPYRCSACSLQGRGFPRPIAALLAASPLSYKVLPEGPWIPRLTLKSLLAERLPKWRRFMRGAAHIVAGATWCRDVLVANGVAPEAISVHRQALSGHDRKRRLRLPLAKRRPLRLGFFGRFAWIKGPDLLLDAVGDLGKRGLAARVELVGPIAASEQTWADKLLAAHAQYSVYLGVKRDTALIEWLDTLDLVVIPSRGLETGPLTLLEAWDRGVPVVGTCLGGIRDFMTAAGQESLLFDREALSSLADAIVRAAQWSADEQPEVSIDGMVNLAFRMESMYRGNGMNCDAVSEAAPH